MRALRFAGWLVRGIDAADVRAALGLGLLAGGLAMVSVPMALIVPGALLTGLEVLGRVPLRRAGR